MRNPMVRKFVFILVFALFAQAGTLNAGTTGSIDQLNGYITQDDLIKNCNISVVTLDKIYRVLEPFKQILFQ